MQAVIMAAGKSTRTWPLTLTRPKPLLPVMGAPLLSHQLRALKGIADEAVIVIGYLGDMIREQFGETFEGISIRYIEQREQRHCTRALAKPHICMQDGRKVQLLH